MYGLTNIWLLIGVDLTCFRLLTLAETLCTQNLTEQKDGSCSDVINRCNISMDKVQDLYFQRVITFEGIDVLIQTGKPL